MDGLAVSIIATLVLIVSWLAGWGASSEDHFMGWAVISIEVVALIFLLALLIGAHFNIVSLV